MPLTYGQVKKIVSRWAGAGGQCPTDDDVDFFTREVLQQLLYEGTNGNYRKFTFCSVKGCITIPYELETPLKVKVDGEVGSVWSKFFEWYQTDQLEGCIPAGNALFEDPNSAPTAYPIPAGGAYVAVTGTCAEAEDAHVIIKGKDATGRVIFTPHNGEQITGEYLRIRPGELRRTTVQFATIDEVYKTPTNGYVQLYWIDANERLKGFLADYSPIETMPSYRQFRLTAKHQCNMTARISILGKIRLKPAYAENDLVPFDNIHAISLVAQSINASYNNDVQGAVGKMQLAMNTIEKENSHKRVDNGQPIEVFRPTSGGAIRNIVSTRRWGWPRNWGF